jgi:TonB family protein
MRNFFTLILFLGITLNGLAQNSVKIYMDANNQKTDSVDAVLVKEVVVDKEVYKITDKDPDGKMLNYGEYSSINPLIENGKSIHYARPDYLYAKGQYLDGKLDGMWYYYSDNKLIDSADYTKSSVYDSKQDCNIITFAKENKKTKTLKEKVLFSLKWYLYAQFLPPPRTLEDTEFFDLEINFIIDVNGTISCIDIPNSVDKDIDAEMIRLLKDFKYEGDIKEPLQLSYTHSRKDEIFVSVEEMPKFSPFLNNQESLDAFRLYVQKNLVYPKSAVENKIQGRVFVQFVIDTYGYVTDVKIVRGVDPSLDAEALRVVKSSPRWIPGKQRGKKVKVQYTFPIVFAWE